jgi:hypothetical protein
LSFRRFGLPVHLLRLRPNLLNQIGCDLLTTKDFVDLNAVKENKIALIKFVSLDPRTFPDLMLHVFLLQSSVSIEEVRRKFSRVLKFVHRLLETNASISSLEMKLVSHVAIFFLL